MPNLAKYPFKTARVIDGKTYIAVEEVNEMLDNLQKLGPMFQQVADATQKLKTVFGDAKRSSDLLLEEMHKAEGKLQ